MPLPRRDFLQLLAAAPIAQVAGSTRTPAAESARLTSPVPFQVLQRQGYDPREAHDHAVGGPRRGHADVPLVWTTATAGDLVWEARVILLEGATGTAVDWTALEVRKDGDQRSAVLRVAAGGWYRIELRGQRGDAVIEEGQVAPVGVGEVLIVAGQSYAEGANDELLKVADPLGRVVALDVERGTWGVAHDPQPHRGTGGTLWPALGDLLVPIVQTPIGFVNVAVGGTAIRQWLPGEALYQGLIAGARRARQFRFVLWQQGESDVIEKTTAAVYTERLKLIRATFGREAESNARWLLAKSTLHPTVYNDPEGEGRIREALDGLWREPGFGPGPDTDVLNGENRGGIGTRRHFTGIGQRHAALMWFASIWTALSQTEPGK